jgi:hypothetical protein
VRPVARHWRGHILPRHTAAFFPDDPECGVLNFLIWLMLLCVCWPLALLALFLYPTAWLVLLPFRLLGIGVDAVFALLRAIVMLPARVLGGAPGK